MERADRGKLTMDHVANSFLVIFAKVDDSCLGFPELAAANTIKEWRLRADDGAMNSPSFGVASDCQV